MTRTPLLSVLVCGTPRRAQSHALPLIAKLEKQATHLPVEILYLLDNKRRSVGLKRQALLDIARGDYVAFVDDDDDVSPDYCMMICGSVALDRPDVATFEQEADIAGQIGRIRFGLGNPNEPFRAGATALRNAWHVCAWSRHLAQIARFPDLMDGEDWAWASQLCTVASTSKHIPLVLHYYFFRPAMTEATGQNHRTP